MYSRAGSYPFAQLNFVLESYWDLSEAAREIDERLFLPLRGCLPADVQRSINIGSSSSCARLLDALKRELTPELFTAKAAMLTELLNTKFEGNTTKTKADLLDMARQPHRHLGCSHPSGAAAQLRCGAGFSEPDRL